MPAEPRSDFRRLGVAMAGASLVLALCAAVVIPAARWSGGAVALRGPVPELRTLDQRSTVYASDGTTVLGVLGVTDRERVTLDEVPPMLVHAVVDTEDATFFTNPGIDVSAMARSLFANLSSGHVLEGGSTITQQLVKNRLLTSKRDLHRKVRELSLALQLDQRFSKRRILEEYLNTVYFGQGAYGVKAAAERFFPTGAGGPVQRGKTLSQLTLADDALLAGLISSPEGNNPFAHPAQARARRDVVLDRMVEQGSITAAQADEARSQPLPAAPPLPDLRPRDYFVDQVQRALLADPRLGDTPQERARLVLRGGLRVVTTLDAQAQARAEIAVASVMPDQPPFTAALAAMDPSSGAIVALIGGQSYDTSQYDLVTHAPGRQPGSTYKVITLAAALEAGYSPQDLLDGTSPCHVERPPFPAWDTANNEPGSGTLTLRNATAESVNCAYAHLIAALGPQAVVDMAHRLGVTQAVSPYLSITLGTEETTPLEMLTVASTLAAEGVRHDPRFVNTVTAPDGKVLIDDTAVAGRPVLGADVAACTVDVLRDVVSSGTGTAAQIPGRDMAGKTGTTDQKTDAWFLGMTPQLAGVVWMGSPTGQIPMTDVGGITVFGGTYPARIWQAFAEAQLAALPPAAFPPGGAVCDRPGTAVGDTGRAPIVQPAPASRVPDARASAPAAPANPAVETAPPPATTVAPKQTPPPTTPTTSAPPPTTTTTTAPPGGRAGGTGTG